MTPRSQFYEDGFCVARGLFDKTLLSEAGTVVERLLSRQREEDRVAHLSLGSLIKTWEDPFFVEMVTAPKVREAFSQMGFTSPRFSNGYILNKPSGSPQTFWHQDWWLWKDPLSYTAFPHQIGVLCYLTDTARENGCLRVIPGSHRKRHILHEYLKNSDILRLRRMEDTEALPFQTMKEEIDVPVSAGDGVIIDARLLHAAHANQSPRRRTGITFWYFPFYDQFTESVRAAIGKTIPPEDWPEPVKEKISPWLPDYGGDRQTGLLSEHPGPALK